jgi:hypothetical protein
MRDTEPREAKSLLDVVADDTEGVDFEFHPPRLEGPISRPVDFE